MNLPIRSDLKDYIFHLEVPSPATKKVESCGGNACPTCGKCRDWYRSGSRWQKRADATCSDTTRTDTDGHPDGGGSTPTYVYDHGPATGWDTTGTTSTRDDHGGRYGRGVYTVTRGTADTSSGHSGLCACKID
jgi:hypothetical protein